MSAVEIWCVSTWNVKCRVNEIMPYTVPSFIRKRPKTHQISFPVTFCWNVKCHSHFLCAYWTIKFKFFPSAHLSYNYCLRVPECDQCQNVYFMWSYKYHIYNYAFKTINPPILQTSPTPYILQASPTHPIYSTNPGGLHLHISSPLFCFAKTIPFSWALFPKHLLPYLPPWSCKPDILLEHLAHETTPPPLLCHIRCRCNVIGIWNKI